MRWRVKEYLEDKMAETQIEWTDSTWNPVAGCSIVTAGCTNCYAMEMARRLEAMGIAKYAGLTRKTGKRTVWNGVVREDREALAIPYGWKKPRKIFVNSFTKVSATNSYSRSGGSCARPRATIIKSLPSDPNEWRRSSPRRWATSFLMSGSAPALKTRMS